MKQLLVEGKSDAMGKFFLSYNAADAGWSDWIQEELEAWGHEVRNHRYDVKSGEDFEVWIEKQLAWADYTVAIYSKDYLNAKWTMDEFNRSKRKAIVTDRPCLLIARVQNCEVQEEHTTINRVDLCGCFEAEARSRLHDYIARTDSPPLLNPTPKQANAEPFPGKLPNNLSISPSSRFPNGIFGRNDIIAKISDSFKPETGRRPIVVLRGIPGSGKTTIAAAYARMHMDNFRLCWWVRAADEALAATDLIELAARLQWIQADEKQQASARDVVARLEMEGRGLLLIYDNAISEEAIRELLPKSGHAHILITSNSSNWSYHEQAVHSWPVELGGDFLVRRIPVDDPVPDSERAKAEEIAREVEGLPLALEMAGAYCALRHMLPTTYIKLFAETFDRVFNSSAPSPREYHEHRPAATSYVIAMEYAREQNPAARDLLMQLAELAPEWIPLCIFEEGRDVVSEPLKDLLKPATSVFDAVLVLTQCGLLTRHSPGDAFEPNSEDVVRMHRFVRRVVPALLMPAEKEEIRASLIRAIEAAYPRADWVHDRAWDRARLLNPHVDHVLKSTLKPPAGSESQAADLMHRMALFLGQTLDDLKKAVKLVDRALQLHRGSKPQDKRKIAEVLGTRALLASTLDSKDVSGEAVRLATEAVSLLESEFGKDHPIVAMSLVTLASVRRNMLASISPYEVPDPSLLVMAAADCERALAILGDVETMDRAHALSVYGRVLSRGKRLSEARLAVSDALIIYERICEKVHPAQARNAVDMAEIMIREEAFDYAKLMLDKARSIYAQDPDLKHGLVLCDGMEAWLEKAQGHLPEALVLLTRAHNLALKVHGPGHVWTTAIERQIATLDNPNAVNATDAGPSDDKGG